MANIHIEARRWFDKPDGNTYHSVRVTVDGKEIGVAPFTYGYGEHYTHTAGELLRKFAPDVAPEDPYDVGRWTWRKESGHAITTDVVDVKTRSALHHGGR